MRTRRPPATPAARSHAPRGRAAPNVSSGARHGLARVLSKAGVCSRSEAARWIAEGRVRVSGRVVRDPEFPIGQPAPPIEVDGQPMAAPQRLYLMLNKPRGVVTTAQDERGRDTVYRCFDGAGLPWIAPVGRLDKASEGLLLFSNDPQWAARLTDPQTGPDKTYHVQVDGLPDAATLAALQAGVEDEGEFLAARAVHVLRRGDKTAWLEVVLDEGRNRHIRRLLAAFDLQVLRLVRVAIGGLLLGDLGKGQWRVLEVSDQQRLGAAAPG
ncbi:rRNA pseudouridine synthase [Stenotrophomonas maltophilia]|uniref:pseudouridine synthase n=2 Tax=Stenotrophomonas TaxID=40323 RepID=UPI0006C53119|nr:MULTISPECIES: pseudouridine synthase [Stenotrophomonas]KOO77873.1 pseudouridine synthase [Stenotrophomonas maltophilia]MBN5126673.1 rRNA pseudouridine synthase [Stenotrophomonas maltophilia]MBN5177485.1 rRNA pseudouridine synthase [Stenotrophomonas maltophilia]MCU1121722.1 rRNA pseudouridine synthase [Stenotrophomonas maltophilia]MDA3306086.1 rRNA pseudouridine synthase [Stenotrophomonas sp. PI_27]